MKRLLTICLALVVVLTGILVASTWPLAALFGRAIYEAAFPETISWDAKNAYAKCDAAVAGTLAWPKHPAIACSAMHLCVNEADLTPAQAATLLAVIRKIPHCADP